MKRIVAIGELLIDFVPQEKGRPLHEVTCFERVAGGAPANVVSAVSRLGGCGSMISQVGKDAFGEHIINALKANGVDTSYVFQTDKANTGLAFVSLDSTGNREFSFFRNPSADLFLSPEQITSEMLTNTAIIHFGSVDLVDWPIRKAHERLIALAQQHDCCISFDPNVRLPLWESSLECQKAIREFLPLANIIKLSDDELEFVTGYTHEKEAAEKLLRDNCHMLILTKGGQGSSVYTRTASAHVPAVCVSTVMDTTGAGDSFTGAFLFQLVHDECTLSSLDHLTQSQLEKYLTFSAKYAALTISKKGAVMATMDEMKEIYGE